MISSCPLLPFVRRPSVFVPVTPNAVEPLLSVPHKSGSLTALDALITALALSTMCVTLEDVLVMSPFAVLVTVTTTLPVPVLVTAHVWTTLSSTPIVFLCVVMVLLKLARSATPLVLVALGVANTEQVALFAVTLLVDVMLPRLALAHPLSVPMMPMQLLV